MPETADVGAAISSITITNRDINYAKSQNSCREKELKISKRIKIPEIFSPAAESLIITAGQKLSSTEAVPDSGVEHKAESFGKKNISQSI